MLCIMIRLLRFASMEGEIECHPSQDFSDSRAINKRRYHSISHAIMQLMVTARFFQLEIEHGFSLSGWSGKRKQRSWRWEERLYSSRTGCGQGWGHQWVASLLTQFAMAIEVSITYGWYHIWMANFFWAHQWIKYCFWVIFKRLYLLWCCSDEPQQWCCTDNCFARCLHDFISFKWKICKKPKKTQLLPWKR